MLQNETEIFTLGLGRNARFYDGHMQGAQGMASKKCAKVRKSKMSPNKKDDTIVASSQSPDRRLKFSYRLKALLKSGAAAVVAATKEDADDPYAFSDCEPTVIRPLPGNTYSRRVATLTSRLCQAAARTAPREAPLSPRPVSATWLSEHVSCDNKISDDEGSSKTMNRLQAKIARNKVIGKHKKVIVAATRSLLEEQLLGEKVKVEPEVVTDPIVEDLYPIFDTDTESESEEETPPVQRHWFSEPTDGMSRESRLDRIRTELRRRLIQAWGAVDRNKEGLLRARKLLQVARRNPQQAVEILQPDQNRTFYNRPLLAPLTGTCSQETCLAPALPLTRHCARHITLNVDQMLFEHCTAKFADNSQCCAPVFDVSHELPLCPEHARKRDNYDRMCAAAKPKKVRRKAKPSAMTRPSKRGKKKRRLHLTTSAVAAAIESSPPHQHHDSASDALEGSSPAEPEDDDEEEEEVVEEDLPLDSVELGTQASRLLEEHDLTNVLNQIPPEAFNDLFTEDKNGEYEPTREETEELERALEAVDKDVKSLEKLSQTQGLLETLMEDHSLVQSLVTMPPDAFTSYNGFVAPASTASGGPKKTHPSMCVGGR